MAAIRERCPLLTNEMLRKMELNGHARHMGSIEDIYGIFNRQKLYRNFSMFAEINEYCNEQQLSLALRNICLKNPILLHMNVPATWPVDENFYLRSEYYSKPHPEHGYITVLPKLKFEDIIANDQPQYSAVMANILKAFHDSGGKYSAKVYQLIAGMSIPYEGLARPTWRLICLPEGRDKEWKKFVFISNHCMCDGRSAANFFHDLKSELNSCNGQTHILENIFDYEEDHALLPKLPEPLEKRIDFRPPFSFIPKLLIWKPIVSFFKYHSESISIRLDETFDESTIVTNIININPLEVDKLRRKIKLHVHKGGTITPFLQVCWFVSLYKWGKLFKRSWFEWLTDVFIPVDVRDLLPEDDEIRASYRYGGNVASIELSPWISEFDVSAGDEKFWNLVTRNQDIISKALKDNQQLNLLGFNTIDIVQNNFNLDKELCSSTLGKARQGTLLSNLGMFSQQTDKVERYSIQDLIFGQFQGSFCDTFSLCVCSTDKKGMNIVLTTDKDVIPNLESWTELCEIFKETILTC